MWPVSLLDGCHRSSLPPSLCARSAARPAEDERPGFQCSKGFWFCCASVAACEPEERESIPTLGKEGSS